uniref:Uncharacterized protein n=1 Tax=Rhizophora mucronata TaxID=61149 RepID=A0A2P2PNT4_RHIMU
MLIAASLRPKEFMLPKSFAAEQLTLQMTVGGDQMLFVPSVIRKGMLTEFVRLAVEKATSSCCI